MSTITSYLSFEKAFIHGYVPEALIERYISGNNLFAVTIAVIFAIPLYIDAVSVLPIIESLVKKRCSIRHGHCFYDGSHWPLFTRGAAPQKSDEKRAYSCFFRNHWYRNGCIGLLF